MITVQQQAIYILGAGGHAKVVMDLVERQGKYCIRGVWDANPALAGQKILGYPILGATPPLDERETALLVAIGSNQTRFTISMRLQQSGFGFGAAIHPAAVIARTVTMGMGTVCMAGVVVNMDAEIGAQVILNTSASVDHDCRIGNAAHIAPGAHLCGGVIVGARTLVGAGATVIPNIRIGCDVIIGAGATVVRDVPDGVTAIGSPARIVRPHKTP